MARVAKVISRRLVPSKSSSRRLERKADNGRNSGMRLHFIAALLSTAFLESSMISAAPAACSLTVKELREKKDGPPDTTKKLPICEDLLSDLR